MIAPDSGGGGLSSIRELMDRRGPAPGRRPRSRWAVDGGALTADVVPCTRLSTAQSLGRRHVLHAGRRTRLLCRALPSTAQSTGRRRRGTRPSCRAAYTSLVPGPAVDRTVAGPSTAGYMSFMPGGDVSLALGPGCRPHSRRAVDGGVHVLHAGRRTRLLCRALPSTAQSLGRRRRGTCPSCRAAYTSLVPGPSVDLIVAGPSTAGYTSLVPGPGCRPHSRWAVDGGASRQTSFSFCASGREPRYHRSVDGVSRRLQTDKARGGLVRSKASRVARAQAIQT